jgi:hypothetical protein
VCQARAGLWAQAERTLSRSFELDPANPVTAFNLAEVLLRRGELERARFYVRAHQCPARAGVGAEPVAGGAHRAPHGQRAARCRIWAPAARALPPIP